MITLTDNAVAAVKTALSRACEPAERLRIMATAGGCASNYLMGLESVSREGDAIVEKDGVKVFVDVGSQPHVAGMNRRFRHGARILRLCLRQSQRAGEVRLRSCG
ncbi:hypothetical protein X727_32420 [Mesorhizobium sp. L103C119B0]|nr:hypothetical protein X727_32420 [Mesorhizobium sp. L103C119B0]